jgi:hypothetical protein
VEEENVVNLLRESMVGVRKKSKLCRLKKQKLIMKKCLLKIFFIFNESV